MNFLAHIYLSGNNEDLIFGNFIADAVKGKAVENYRISIQEGIRLHRDIDNFTDKHHIFKKSRQRLMDKYHKFSGVIVDMYYDHFLAANWQEYSTENLDIFVDNAYKILKRNFFLLPPRYKMILPFMISSNWLVNYAQFNRLQNNFERMAKRTTFESGMENAVFDLKKDYNQYNQEFREFFPEIIRFVNEKWDIKI
ncbi:MAG: ACP phosphodiesterase [Bacteroidales bacterium]|nr:ACP phosphodiesterase [Bacteroidales bacterium]